MNCSLVCTLHGFALAISAPGLTHQQLTECQSDSDETQTHVNETQRQFILLGRFVMSKTLSNILPWPYQAVYYFTEAMDSLNVTLRALF